MMQNALYHTWELGQSSWQHLSQMILVSDQVTVWGPSYFQILDAHKNYGLQYNPDQFLELVRQGFITVAARPQWYSGSAYRNKLKERGYALTDWHDNFDSEMQRMADGQQVRLSHEPEGVDDWVRDQEANETQYYKTAIGHVKRGHVPTGWIDVAKRKYGKDGGEINLKTIVRGALTTARMHRLAADELGCNIGVEPLDCSDFFADLGAYPTSDLRTIGSSTITIEEIIYHVNKRSKLRLDQPGGFDQHIRFLNDIRDLGLKKYLQAHSGHAITIHNDLIRGLVRRMEGAVARSTSSRRYPTVVNGAAAIATSVLASRVALKANRRNFLISSFALAISSAVEPTLNAVDAAIGILTPPTVDVLPDQHAMLIALHGPDLQIPNTDHIRELIQVLSELDRALRTIKE